MPVRWPHQIRCGEMFRQSVERGSRRILLTAPPGAGKTTMALDIITDYLNRGEKAVFYSNRRSLIMQTSRAMLKGNLDHGIRMAGCEDERHLPFQIASIQTEASRVLKKGRIELHDAKIVVLDEPHLNTGKDARTIMDKHVEAGAVIFAPTATPIDLDGLYDDLIVAGTPSELRACGAIVPCMHYGPDEPDLRDLGKLITGKDLTEKQATKAIMRQGIYGRVLGSFFAINPTKRPTLLFAPGVDESFWFAAEFAKKGIKAAHIDGDRIWISDEGDGMDSTDENRLRLFDRHESGEITVICNRFVMREGIDLPWASHLIFATIFGSLASYIQSGGRGGRAYPGKAFFTLQDHGGNWWRHGSLNEDREWFLDCTSNMMTGARKSRLQRKLAKEPSRCPQCAMILSGMACRCGFVITAKSRPVVQSDGSLIEHRGDIFRAPPVVNKPDTFAKWKRMYYRARNSQMTFAQAEALFFRENFYYPPQDLPKMPKDEYDRFRKVRDVQEESLI